MSDKKIYESISQIINQETGELIEQRKEFVRRVTKPKFIQVYLEDMAGIMNLKSLSQFKVLSEIWRRAQYSSNEIILVKGIKEEIAKELNYSFQTVENSISGLAKKNIILKKSTSIYILNPKWFFKGSEEDRNTVLKISVKYEIVDDESNNQTSIFNSEEFL